LSEALAALREGVAALLEARGAHDVAEVARRADLELVGPGEAWSLGGRSVHADHVALATTAPDYAFVTGDPARLAALRDAAAAAMRTPSTELAELVVVLRLPGLDRAWSGAYRQAPRRDPAPAPDPAAVLAAACALLDAEGEGDAAAIAGRATLERAAVPTTGPLGLARWALRLAPADYARASRDASLERRLTRAVEAAATRADERVASIDLALAIA
jgi:hypothetical protein